MADVKKSVGSQPEWFDEPENKDILTS